MAKSLDHPSLDFVQAKAYEEGRDRKRPLWIVIHDMEAKEYSGRAESTAQYFATLPDGRTVSSHYTVDNDSVVQCVRLADTAYTVGNTPGNSQGINWELSGFARQSRAEWLDPFGLAMFAQMRPIVQSDAAKFKIPLVRRTVAELKAFIPGVTSHNDLGIAFGGTTHTDPGPFFPWDTFLSMMHGKGTSMFIFHVVGSGFWYLSDGIHRRPLPGAAVSNVRNLLINSGVATSLGDVMPTAGMDPEVYAEHLGGPLLGDGDDPSSSIGFTFTATGTANVAT